MFVLFTDFGWADPYAGQAKAVLHGLAPDLHVVDLLHAVPDFNAHAGAHLLDALKDGFPEGSVFFCVVDPGVGGPRAALAVEADGRYYVGPDNGLLSVVAARARALRVRRIDWRPERLAKTFHGRDLFAPVAARIAREGLAVEGLSEAALTVDFGADDLARVIYIDHYGNAWTGLRARHLGADARVQIRGHALARRDAFHEANKGEAFWYMNSSGLLEIAANRASAAETLGLRVGDVVNLSGSPDSRLH